jgi:hypothetical protein
MPRILPLNDAILSTSVKEAFEEHVIKYNGRYTNMKATLAHSLVSFEVYMQWYRLYAEVEAILGKRLASMYSFAISEASDCPLCSTFFRKIIIDSGETPESLQLNDAEKQLLSFGSSIAKYQGHINDDVYKPIEALYSRQDLVVLIAFAGQMIATNIFNNVIETTIDDYLKGYLA